MLDRLPPIVFELGWIGVEIASDFQQLVSGNRAPLRA
jgi:hypothetical protein